MNFITDNKNKIKKRKEKKRKAYLVESDQKNISSHDKIVPRLWKRKEKKDWKFVKKVKNLKN